MGSIFNVPLVIVCCVNENILTKTLWCEIFQGPKKRGGAIIRGVPYLEEIRYVFYDVYILYNLCSVHCCDILATSINRLHISLKRANIVCSTLHY